MASALSVPSVLPYDTGVSTARPRRRFSAAYKQQILAEAAACTKPGQLGALLRREGLYSSHLSLWRTAAKRGETAARRGPKPKAPDPSAKRIAALERALAKTTVRLERAELIIDAQKSSRSSWA